MQRFPHLLQVFEIRIQIPKVQSTMQQERMSNWVEKWERWEDRIAKDGSEMFEPDFKLIFLHNTKLLENE